MLHVYEITVTTVACGRAVGEQSVGGNCLAEHWQVLNYNEKCSQSSGTGNIGCGAGVLLELPAPGLRHRATIRTRRDGTGHGYGDR